MDSFGKLFVISDSGDTHAAELRGSIDGCPPNIAVDMDFVQQELRRRAPSLHPHSTQRKEGDRVLFHAGIVDGKTTGETIIYSIPNNDVQFDEKSRYILKPSHASYTYKMKYGIADNSGCGRASARQTACRVVAGAIAKCFLNQYAVVIHAIGENMGRAIPEGDTCGATARCTVDNLPAGLGEPIYDKLSARLAFAMFSINSVKGFEIGKGFDAANMLGSEYNDLQDSNFQFATNHDGGVQAGISNGEKLYFRVAFKPIPTLQKAQKTITFAGQPAIYKGNKRNDLCVIPRVLAVVEAMTAVTIADFILLAQQNNRIIY